MTETSKLQIAIVGAGIAGLGAAIALSDHPGVDVQIYERATELREIGASIALGPNGMRTLDRLGVDDALSPDVAFRNKSKHPMIYRHYKTGEVVSVDNHKGEVEQRHLTSRFYRAHLQQALAGHVEASRIHLNKPFQSVTFDEGLNRQVLTFGDGTTATADIILGADGIHSKVRTFFVPSSRTEWTGWVAFRSVFPISHLAHIPDIPEEAEHIWAPDRTLFVSKLGKGLFTVVASHQTDPNDGSNLYQDATWDSKGDVSVIREWYKDWHPRYRAIVDATPWINVYPNSAAHALDTWVLGDGRVTLAGDAAHAHGGAFAAGGSLALDDAWAFAEAIRHVFPEGARGRQGTVATAEDIARALRIYERTRKAHTDRVMAVVHEQNKKKVERLGTVQTDEELRARLQNRYDPSWIHEHDVQLSFAKALESLAN